MKSDKLHKIAFLLQLLFLILYFAAGRLLSCRQAAHDQREKSRGQSFWKSALGL